LRVLKAHLSNQDIKGQLYRVWKGYIEVIGYRSVREGAVKRVHGAPISYFAIFGGFGVMHFLTAWVYVPC
jgi:hypothetical protein